MLSLITALISLFFMPKYYRSTAILVPANPVLADKAHFLNPNIQGLYSYFGNGDDLDRIVGIASMDTVYKQLVDELDLVHYYRLQANEPSEAKQSMPENQSPKNLGKDPKLLRRKALKYLKEDLHLEKQSWVNSK